MLISFSVENFRSFAKKQTLYMVTASKYFSEKEQKENNFKSNVISTNNKKYPELLKTACIYGANASGKTKFIDAFFVFVNFFKNKLKEVGELNDFYEPFAFNNKYFNEPTHFEIKFLLDNNIYEYSLSFDKQKIIDEILIKNNKIIYNIKKEEFDKEFFKGSEKNTLNKIKNKNYINPFLKEFVNSGDSNILNNIESYFREKLHAANTKFYFVKTTEMFNNENYKEDILNFVKKSDKTINNIKIEDEEIKDGRKVSINNVIFKDGKAFERSIKGIHKNNTILSWDLESLGTKAIFGISGAFIDVLKNGGTIFFDELDSSLHPDLLVYLIQLFHNEEINIGNGQLIFTAHNDILLDKVFDERKMENINLFRRDQVYFTQKNDEEETELYPLACFKNVRTRDTIVKSYRNGLFGARPVLEEPYWS